MTVVACLYLTCIVLAKLFLDGERGFGERGIKEGQGVRG